MTDAELSALSMPELKQLQMDIAKAIAVYDGQRKTGTFAALEEKALEFGYKLADLLGLSSPKPRKHGPPRQKYRNPANPKITWSGRGRTPHWFSDALASGKTRDDLEI